MGGGTPPWLLRGFSQAFMGQGKVAGGQLLSSSCLQGSATGAQMREPSVGDGVGGTGWATFQGPETSFYCGVFLAPVCFHAVCGGVDAQSFNTSQMLFFKLCLCYLLQVAGVSGKNTPNLLKTFPPFNPALCSRNIILT